MSWKLFCMQTCGCIPAALRVTISRTFITSRCIFITVYLHIRDLTFNTPSTRYGLETPVHVHSSGHKHVMCLRIYIATHRSRQHHMCHLPGLVDARPPDSTPGKAPGGPQNLQKPKEKQPQPGSPDPAAHSHSHIRSPRSGLHCTSTCAILTYMPRQTWIHGLSRPYPIFTRPMAGGSEHPGGGPSLVMAPPNPLKVELFNF